MDGVRIEQLSSVLKVLIRLAPNAKSKGQSKPLASTKLRRPPGTRASVRMRPYPWAPGAEPDRASLIKRKQLLAERSCCEPLTLNHGKRRKNMCA